MNRISVGFPSDQLWQPSQRQQDFMSGKQTRMYAGVFDWCRLNPGKEAAILSPEGALIVVFHPNKGVK